MYSFLLLGRDQVVQRPRHFSQDPKVLRKKKKKLAE